MKNYTINPKVNVYIDSGYMVSKNPKPIFNLFTQIIQIIIKTNTT